MATLYLVRHGQSDYSGLQERGMFGFGRDFAPLSPLGVQQAEETARSDAEMPIRAVQIQVGWVRFLHTASDTPSPHGIQSGLQLIPKLLHPGRRLIREGTHTGRR